VVPTQAGSCLNGHSMIKASGSAETEREREGEALFGSGSVGLLGCRSVQYLANSKSDSIHDPG
jgi:hypothetical protein